jgi:23S rRNA G2445 N2-methylase RlmL
MFATAVPGLARLAGRELETLDGVRVTGYGFDGRSDVVLLDVDRGRRRQLRSVRTIEDLFAEVGRTLRTDGDRPHWIASRTWQPERVQRALSIWAEEAGPLTPAITFRVIARVLQETSFLRTDLRRELAAAVSRDKRKWSIADPARLEVWISEYAPGRLVAGIRLSDASMRQHRGRVTERSGALRPTVAAAMVGLAGPAGGLLLDPCCGSGTILAEALAAGWEAEGRDADPAAMDVSRRNVPAAAVKVGDARRLDLAGASVGACVSNLPFGQQYDVQGEMGQWLAAVLAETARVTRPGGRVILLAPQLPRSVVPAQLRMRERHQIRLLGTKTTIWAYDRA